MFPSLVLAVVVSFCVTGVVAQINTDLQTNTSTEITDVGTPDYMVTANPQAATVPRGGSMNFMVTVTPANGFADAVDFNCAVPAGITCTLNPPSVTPAGAAVSSTLTATVSTGYGRVPPMGIALGGLGLFGCFFAGARRNRRRKFSVLLAVFASLLITCTMLVSAGCGSYHSPAMAGNAAMVVAGTSGALSHATTINVTVQ